MAARRSGWRRWGAVVAAYLLVVQAALTGLTLGAHAAAPQTGPFTDIICSPSATSNDVAPEQTKHQGAPNCCVLGCFMAGGGSAPAPETAFVAPPQALAVATRRSQPFDAVAPSPERSPRTTRAPPTTA